MTTTKVINLITRCGARDNLEEGIIPSSQNEFDDWHDQICQNLTELAKECFTDFFYGRSAKLINVYLKTQFLGNSESPYWHVLHPPIDRQILSCPDIKRELRDEHNRKLFKKAWTKFDRDEYRKVIATIRDMFPNRYLWEVEKCWEESA